MLIAVTICVVIFLLAELHIGTVGAHEDKGLNAECTINRSTKDCDEGLVCVPFNPESGNGKCEYPEPTASPSPTPTPVYHHYGCNADHECVWVEGKGENSCNPDWVGDCLIPTPTPTVTPGCGDDCGASPSATPTPTVTPTPQESQPSGFLTGSTTGGGNNNAGTPPNNPVCTIAIDAPLLQEFHRISPTQVEVSWWLPKASIDKQEVLFGYGSDALTFSDTNVGRTVTSYTINDLQPNVMVWVMVRAVSGSCISDSSIIDP